MTPSVSASESFLASRSGDLASNVVAFCRLLRTRGLPAGPGEAADALRALEAVSTWVTSTAL